MGNYDWAIGVGIIILAVSLGRTLRAVGGGLARRSGRTEVSGDAAGGELRAEVEDLRRRLAELEERVDFTERLLAKQRDGAKLAPPRSAT